MKRFWLFATLFFLFNAVNAQYMVRIRPNQLTDTEVQLRGMAFDQTNFIPKDTLQLDKKQFTSRYNKSIFGGIYYLYFPKSKQKILFTLSNRDTLIFDISGKDYLANVKVNSPKNQLFLEYQRLEQKYAYLDSALDAELKAGKKYNLSNRALFFQAKTKALTEFRTQALSKLKKDEPLYLYFKTLNALDDFVPSRRAYQGREDFLNQFDLAEPKILFSPALKEVIFEYYSSFPLHGDSLLKASQTVFKKLKCDNKAYPYVFDYTARILRSREVLQHEQAYRSFLQERLVQAKCPLPDPAKQKAFLGELAKLKAIADSTRSLNLVLKDTAGIAQNMHAFASQFDYTVLVFYDPNCEHCQTDMPILESKVKELEAKRNIQLGIYAVCNSLGVSKVSWLKFIQEHQLYSRYCHVTMAENDPLREFYDAYATPTYFLIDREAKIIARKVSPGTLAQYLSFPKR